MLSATVGGGIPGYFYSWSNAGETSSSIIVSPMVTTTYSVTVFDTNGCSGIDSMTVTVGTFPTLNLLTPTEDLTICEGDTTTLSVSAANGTPPYNFSWSNGPSGASQEVSPASNTSYTVEVTDANGCSASLMVSVIVDPLPEVNAGMDTTICAGGTASLSATGFGGTSPYSFEWSTSQTGSNISVNPLSETVYSVTLTDDKDCIATDDVVVMVSGPVALTISGGTELCAGSSLELQADATGGTGPYTYSWSNGLGTGPIKTVSPLDTTTYTVTATDAIGCEDIQSVTINVGSNLSVDLGPGTTLCNGEMLTIMASVTGGEPAYTYAWSVAGETDPSITVSPMTSTLYSVTVTDMNGCSGTAEIMVNVGTAPSITVLTPSQDLTICEGASTTLEVEATGGTPPYEYSWLNGPTGPSQTVSPVVTTTYTVEVTDSIGCTASQEIEVVVGSTVALTISGGTELCAGSSLELQANATGGTGPYTYSWSNGLGTGPIKTVSPLDTTTYTVTATDALGCEDVQSITINVNPALGLTIEGGANVCFGSAAVITAIPSGGTGPYTYQWSDDLGTEASQTVTPSSEETYAVTVTDLVGCTIADSITISVGNNLNVDLGPDTTLCGGGSITISALVSGGEPDYTYSWSVDGETGESITVTPVEATTTYSVIVIDNNGCSGTGSIVVEIGELPTLDLLTDSSALTICEGSSLVLEVEAMGGVLPYNYTWSNGATGSTQEFSPDGPTTYTVAVEDGNGCMASLDVEVAVDPLPEVEAGMDQDICFGAEATLTAIGSGGTAPYEFIWSNDQMGAEITVNPDDTTTYTVTVTDEKGCMASDAVTINVNSPLALTIEGSPNICFASAAVITVVPSGGTGPYTYQWSDGLGTEASQSITEEGTYAVTVTDLLGCTNADSIAVTVGNNLSVDLGPDTTLCDGASITLEPIVGGGTPEYSYFWAGDLGMDSSVTVTPTEPTAYSVIVIDQNGCNGVGNITVFTGSSPEVSVLTDPADLLICEGEITLLELSPDGGIPPYEVNWNNGAIGESQSVSPIETSTFTAVVSDSVGCSTTIDIEVMVNPAPTVEIGEDQTICLGASTTLTAVGSGGTVADDYTYTWSDGQTGAAIQVNPSMDSTYTVTITDDLGCSSTDQVAVLINSPIEITINGDTEICSGVTTTLTAFAAGGTDPYEFLWSDDLGTESSISVSPDESTTYTVTVTDNIGCESEASLTVNVTNTLSVDLGPDTTVCEGNEITITAMVSGGDPDYTYLWSVPGETGESVTTVPTAPTSYVVIVTDNNGCTATGEVTVSIGEPPALSLTTDPADLSICAGQSTTIEVMAEGGTEPYEYNWLNGASGSSQSVSPSIPTTYTALVEDGNGCTASLDVDVSILAGPSVEVGQDQTICPGASANLSATGSGGIDPYLYAWSDGQAGDQITVSPDETTIYIVTITDDIGCTSSDTVSVLVENTVEVSIAGEMDLCPGSSTLLTALPIGGTGDYTYQWSDDLGTEESAAVNPPDTTSYSVTVMDSAGCTAEQSFTVNVADDITVDLGPDTTLCDGAAITLTAIVSGGVADYDYLWSIPGEMDPTVTISPNVQTNYLVIVTDAIGCTGTGTVSVAVGESPELNLVTPTEDLQICNGQSVALQVMAEGGSGFYQYNWPNGETGAIQTVMPLETTSYDVTVEDSNGCFATLSVEVEVTEGPSVEIQSVSTICPGSSTTLMAIGSNGQPPYDYTWSDDQTGPEIEVMPNENTTYTVTVIDQIGCVSTAEAIVAINDLALLSNTVNNASCDENNGTIDMEIQGGIAPFTISWSDGSEEEDRTDLGAGTYEVTVIDALDCEATLSFGIQQLGSPTIVGGINRICDGDLQFYTLDFEITGGQPPYEVEGLTGTVNGTSYLSDPIVSGDYYSFEIRDDNNCLTELFTGSEDCLTAGCESFAGTLPIETLEACGEELVQSVAPADAVLESDDAQMYILHDTPDPELGTTIFARNDVPAFMFSMGTDLQYEVTYYLSSVVGNVDGMGGVDLTDICLSVSEGQPVIFHQQPVADAGEDQIICESDIQLAASQDVGVGAWLWLDGPESPIIQNILDPNTIVIAGATGLYRFIWSVDNQGCEAEDTVSVTVLSPLGFSNLSLECVPDGGAYTVSFEVSGGNPDAYQISGGNISVEPGPVYIFTSDPVTSESAYDFEVSDDSTCDPLVIQGEGIFCPECSSNAGAMDMQSIELCQTDTAVADHLTENLLLDGIDDVLLFILHDGAAVPFGNILATNTEPVFTFQSGTMETNVEYFITAVVGNDDGAGGFDENDLCLSVSNGTPVIFLPGPPAPGNLQASANLLCPGEVLELSIDQVPGLVLYHWETPVGEITTSTPSLLVDPFTEAHQGNYAVAIDQGGCRSLSTEPVEVLLAEEIAGFSAGEDEALCGVLETTLEASIPDFAEGFWSNSTGAAINAPDEATTLVQGLQAGANPFVWTVFTENCEVTDTVVVTYEPFPVAADDIWEIKADKNNALLDLLANDSLEGIDLDNLVTEVYENPDSYPGLVLDSDGTVTISREESIEQEVEFSFSYIVCNTSPDCELCDTATVNIVIAYDEEVSLLTDLGLTPNRNNPVWGFSVNRAMLEGSIQIADRWGRIVLRRTLEAAELQKGRRIEVWDGTFKNKGGEPLPSGAYYFWFTGKAAEDLTVEQSGTLYLIR